MFVYQLGKVKRSSWETSEVIRRKAILLTLAVLAAGCGGGNGDGDAASIPGGADPEAVQVIDDWAKALADGDIDAAADYFKVPSLAQNGTAPLRLGSRQAVILFNASLPCGARLIRAEDHAGYVLATFVLTERPGPGECGDGVGAKASTAFRIEDGKIAEWRRASPGGGEPPPAGEIT
jgi:limonene-1,2-epoxide hydrolase